jgi:hypothetical protein
VANLRIQDAILLLDYDASDVVIRPISPRLS